MGKLGRVAGGGEAGVDRGMQDSLSNFLGRRPIVNGGQQVNTQFTGAASAVRLAIVSRDRVFRSRPSRDQTMP